jgi:crotonobetainyl-CoA:carnitine CoA-transferase CaiB-like acyl-CoA transferase
VKPLKGLTIVDFSRVLAGPMSTQILAELGARVIKIERPGTGDESRLFEPHYPNGESGYFFAFNRTKESITLNLKSKKGQEIAKDICAKSDVVIENFLPGQMAKMGLGYDDLCARNPNLIYVSNTGFGQDGPYKDRKGYDTIFQALSGIMHLTGYPDAPPAKVGIPVSDMVSALWLCVAVMSGVIGRGVSGKGCYVDVAMLDVQVSLLAIAAARNFTSGEDPGRVGTEHLGRVPSAAFECADGRWVHISASDQHWVALCEVLGLDALATDAELAKNVNRVHQRERVMGALRTGFLEHKAATIASQLRARDVPVGEVNSVAEILTDPHISARGTVGHFNHPTEGKIKGLRTPLKFDGFEDPELGVPPVLGAQTASILSEFAGLDTQAHSQLKKDGVV